MHKLIATLAVAASILAASFAVSHAAETDSHFGCGAPPAIDDPALLADLEAMTGSMVEWASRPSAEVRMNDRIENIRLYMVHKYSSDVEDLVNAKLHHMACVLEKDPNNGLASRERLRLGEINGGEVPVEPHEDVPTICACGTPPPGKPENPTLL